MLAIPWPTLLAETGRRIQKGQSALADKGWGAAAQEEEGGRERRSRGVRVSSPVPVFWTAAARSNPSARGTSVQGGDDGDFRARLWTVGFVCDALDTMNQWYFAIIIKTNADKGEVLVHYDGWMQKYDEWIDADSSRLQPFLSRARLAARPFISRGPGHASQSINLDSLLGLSPAPGSSGVEVVPYPGAQPSPPTSQYVPSVEANSASDSQNAYRDTRQLAFDLSAAIASMGEQQATGSSADGSAARLDCSAQLRSFALKLHKAIDHYPAADSTAAAGVLDIAQVSAYALTDPDLLACIAPHASHPPLHSAVPPKQVPITLTVNAQGGITTSGVAAISAACAAGILPHPSHFMAQSISSLSCLADLSSRNHCFLNVIGVAYEREHLRTLAKHGTDNFRAGLAAEIFRNAPFGSDTEEPQEFASQSLQADLNLTALPSSLRRPVPASASLPICSYLLQLIQQQLLHKPLLPPTDFGSVVVSARRPRGRIPELRFLVPLSVGEHWFMSQVQAFMNRLVSMNLPPLTDRLHRAEVSRVRHTALATSMQLALALSSQQVVEDAVLQLLRFFSLQLSHLASNDTSPLDQSDEERDEQADLLQRLAALTQRWSRCMTADTHRLLGQTREEISSGLCEAREAQAAALLAVAPPVLSSEEKQGRQSLLDRALREHRLPLFPHPSEMPSCSNLHPAPLNESVRLCSESSGAFLYILSADFGLLKLGTGEAGSVAGQVVRQNVALAVHAPFAHLAFMPSPLPASPLSYAPSVRYGVRGQLLLRTQLCPNKLLLIDAESLFLTGASIPIQDDEAVVAAHSTATDVAASSSSSPPFADASISSWELSFAPSNGSYLPFGSGRLAAKSSSPFVAGAPLGGGYDPSTLPPVVYPPTWRADVLNVGFILDAQDSRGCWYPGQVIGVGDVLTQQPFVRIKFDGWSSLHYETIPAWGPRLVPFGSRINRIQRFSNSKQQGDQLIDLAEAVRDYKRRTGQDLFVTPNLNTPEFAASLRVGSVVDACDSSAMWYCGQIVKMTDEAVTVQFDGWKSDYNESIPLHSPRLAPFLTNTNLNMRGKDPQQNAKNALNLDAAIAEARARHAAIQAGLGSKSAEEYFSPEFLRTLEEQVICRSEWGIGSSWEIPSDAAAASRASAASSATAASIDAIPTLTDASVGVFNLPAPRRSFSAPDVSPAPSSPSIGHSEIGWHDQGRVLLRFEASGFVLDDTKAGVHRKVYVNVKRREGIIGDNPDEVSAPRSMEVAASAAVSNSSSSSALPRAPGKTSGSAATIPSIISAEEARQYRAIADASLPFFFVDSFPANDRAHLLLLVLQPDGVRYSAVWLDVSKANIAANSLVKDRPILLKRVDLQDTLPAHPVSNPSKDASAVAVPAAKKDAKAAADPLARDLDRHCHSCGTFLTPTLPHPPPPPPAPNSLAQAPSWVQLQSPGVLGYVRCTHTNCEKAKLLLCIPCSILSSYPAPHDENHVLMRLEHAVEPDGPEPATSNTPVAPVVYSTATSSLMALFDARDDSLILSLQHAVPAPGTLGSIAAGVRAMDFRVFCSHSGALLAAPTPQSNASILCIHNHVADYSLFPSERGNNPRASEATIFKINAKGNLGRSMWTHKSASINPRRNPHALIFRLPEATSSSSSLRDKSSSSIAILVPILSCLLNSIAVVENQEVLLANFSRVSNIVCEVGSLYSLACKSPDGGPGFDLVEQLFSDSLHLLSSYLSQLLSVWPMVRPENPITSKAASAELQAHKKRVKELVVDKLLLPMMEADATGGGGWKRSVKVEALLAHVATSSLGFIFDSWLERMEFVRTVIRALPSERAKAGASSSSSSSSAAPINDAGSLAHVVLHQLLHSTLLRNFKGNPAGNSCSATGHGFFVDLECNARDLGVALPVVTLEGQAEPPPPPTLTPEQLEARRSGSIFGSEFEEVLEQFSELCLASEDGSAQPSVQQLVVRYLLIAFEFHLGHVIPSSAALAQSQTSLNGASTGSKLGNVLSGDMSLQFSQAKPAAAVMMRLATKVLSQLHATLLAHTSRTVPLMLSESALHLYCFSVFQLIELNFRLVSAADVIALLPVLFGVSYDLEAKYRQSREESPSHEIVIEPDQAVVCTSSLPVGANRPVSEQLSQLSALLKTAFLALLKELYPSGSASDPAHDAVSLELSGGGASSGESAPRVQHLSELANVAGELLSSVHSAFLTRFLTCSSPAKNSLAALEPEQMFDALLQQCLLEMGGGASSMSLDFAWTYEKTAAATLMRYVSVVAEGGASTAAVAESPLSPGKSTVASSGGSRTSLLELCFHFSRSLDIHLLLSKASRRHTRILNQSETPNWLKQMVLLLFENVRTPLLDMMRAQPQHGTKQTDASASLSSAGHPPRPVNPLASTPENKEEKRPSSPLADQPTVPSPSPSPPPDKLHANTATKAVVAQWLQNANFLLLSDFSGTVARSSDPLRSARPTPKLSPQLSTPSRSPRPTPLLPLDQLALGGSQPSVAGFSHFRSSSFVGLGGAGAVSDDESDGDDTFPPSAAIPLVRSLSDRIVSTLPSTAPALLSSHSGSSGVFGHSLGADAPTEPTYALASFSSAPSPLAASPTPTAVHSQIVRQTRRCTLASGSGRWIFSLLRQATPRDQDRIREFLMRQNGAYQLTQARVELIRLMNTKLFNSDDAAEPKGALQPSSPLFGVSRSSPTIPMITSSQLLSRSVAFDQLLPLIWNAISQQASGNAASNAQAAAGAANGEAPPPVVVTNLRVHLLHPTAAISQLCAKAASRQQNLTVGGSATGSSDDQLTLLVFLKGLSAWLDASVALMNAPNAASAASSSSSNPSQSAWTQPQHLARLRLLFHFLSLELHATTRDKTTLLSSGVLTSLVRFAFHPRVISDLNELSRIAWTVFSFLIANVLGGASISGSTAVAHLQVALRPLQDVILSNLTEIRSRIPSFNALQLHPPPELLSMATRYVPPTLDTDRLAVDQLVDAKDSTGAWIPAKIVKLERRLNGWEAFVQFSGWPENNNEWIPIKSGKLAALFSQADVSAYSNNGRPARHKLDLSAQIAEYQARQAPPLTDADKALAKANAQEVQSSINEKIVVTVNMLRIVCAVAHMSLGPTSGMATSPTTAASPRLQPLTVPLPSLGPAASTSSALCMLSSFLSMLVTSPMTRPLPMILQLEVLTFVRKRLQSGRYSVADFDAVAASNPQNCLSAQDVVKAMLRLLGGNVWTARAFKAQPSMQAVSEAFVPEEIFDPSPTRVALRESWLWQNWTESNMSGTDGARKLQELLLQLILDSWGAVDKATATTNANAAQWKKLLVSAIEESISAVPEIVAKLAAGPATAFASEMLDPSACSASCGSDLGLDDSVFFQLHASLKLLSGAESYLRQGTRISMRLCEETENVDLDSHQDTLQYVASGVDPTDPQLPPSRTDAFDFSTILHGYVRSFNPAPMSSVGVSSFLSAEVLRELDAAADPDDPEANATNLGLQDNAAPAAADAANAALSGGVAASVGGQSNARYTVLPSTLSRVRPLPARHLITKLLEPQHSQTLKDAVWRVLQSAVKQPMPTDSVTSSSLMLAQLQYESLRVLCAQLDSSWQTDWSELVELMSRLQSQTAAFSSTFDLDLPSPALPRTDVYFSALSLLNSRVWQLERDLVNSARIQMPPSFSSVQDVPIEEAEDHASSSSAASQSAAPAVLLDIPPILAGIESVRTMGFSTAQARAAFVRTGSADVAAAMEVLLGEDGLGQAVSDAQWNAFLDRQGARLSVELYLRQQAQKAAPAAAPAAPAPPPPRALSSVSLTSQFPLSRACASCAFFNPAHARSCAACYAALTPDAVSSSAVASNPAGTVLIKPRNFEPEDLFLGPSVGDSGATGQPLHRTPLTRVLLTGRNVIGLSVGLKTPISTQIPHCSLQTGIVVKLLPVESASAAAACLAGLTSGLPKSREVARVRGVALVRFVGSLRSTQPAPATFAWISIHDLFLEPISSFDLACQAASMALMTPREEIERGARDACFRGIHSLAKGMLAAMARHEMMWPAPSPALSAASMDATAPSAFSLAQLLSVLPIASHPIDSMPTIPKQSSKQRMRLVEDVVAYLLRRPRSDSPGSVSPESFERFIAQCAAVVDAMDFKLNVEVQIPLASTEPLRLVPVQSTGSAAPALSPDSTVPGVALVVFRSDAWTHSSHSSHVLSFWADPAHTRLLRQFTFPAQPDAAANGKHSKSNRAPPPPFALPTPCYLTFVDSLSEKPRLRTHRTAGAVDVLSTVLFVTPFSVDGLNHASFLVDASVYLMTEAARCNGMTLDIKQKQTVQSRIALPICEKLMTLLTDTLQPHQYLPSNIAFTCFSLLTQIYALWSGLSIATLPPLVRAALRGPASPSDISLCASMAKAIAASSRGAGSFDPSFDTSSWNLFVRLLSVDAVVYAQVLDRFVSEATMTAGYSVYHLAAVETMVSFRLLLAAHATAHPSARSSEPLKFDLVAHGEHLTPLRSQLQREAITEKTAAVAAREAELADFASSHPQAALGVPLQPSDSKRRDEVLLSLMLARAALQQAEQMESHERRLVDHVVLMIRRACGLPKRVAQPKPKVSPLLGMTTSGPEAAREMMTDLLASFPLMAQAHEQSKAAESLRAAVAAAVPPASSSSTNVAPSGSECELCEEGHATVSCPLCQMVLCAECDRDLHMPVRSRSHTRVAINSLANSAFAQAAASVEEAESREMVSSVTAATVAAIAASSAGAASESAAVAPADVAASSSAPSSIPASVSAASAPSSASSSSAAALSPAPVGPWVCDVCQTENLNQIHVCVGCSMERPRAEQTSSNHAQRLQYLQDQVRRGFEQAQHGSGLSGMPAAFPGIVDSPRIPSLPPMAMALDMPSPSLSPQASPRLSAARLPLERNDSATAEFAAVQDAAAAVAEKLQAKLDNAAVCFINLSPTSSIGNILLGARMEGSRWMGLQAEDGGAAARNPIPAAVADADASTSSSASSVPPVTSLEHSDSNRSQPSESDASPSAGLRQPLSALLLSSTPVRLQLFHNLLTATAVKDRSTPEFVFDTSDRWQERLSEHTAEGVAAITAKKKDGGHSTSNSGISSSSNKLSLFNQLYAQLSTVHPMHLRGPCGEFSFKVTFAGAADEGAQGFVGMFKQIMSSMSRQMSQAAYRPDSLSESLLILVPNGLQENGSNRNMLIPNPALMSMTHLKRFFGLGQLLGCAIRSATCVPLDMCSLFWKLLLNGVDSILGGPADVALANGLRELKQIDATAANMLSHVIAETNEEAFHALNLTFTTFLSGGTVLIDLFPGGSHQFVRYADRGRYVRLVLYHRLNESAPALQAIRFGLRSILPSTCPHVCNTLLFGGEGYVESLPSPSCFQLLRPAELELLVCGMREVDLALLRAHTTVKNCPADSPLIANFWRVLEGFSPADRARYLQFSWGRSRLPANFAASQQHMTINVIDLPQWWRHKFPPAAVPASLGDDPEPAGFHATVEEAAALRLPKSQTCFFIVDMPAYPNLEILRHKLTMALTCTDINF